MRKQVCGGLAAVLMFGAGAADAADYPTTVLSQNPIAYFRLTTPATGSAVNGYTTAYTATTGTGPGAPLAADPGNTGTTFAGNNAAPSEIRTSLSGGIAGTGSLNLWLNLGALSSRVGHIQYLAGESQSGNDLDFQINDDDVLRFYTGAGENTGVAYGANYVGSWHMLTATFDGTVANGYRNIYIDGVLAQSYTGGVNGAAKTSQFTMGYSDVFGGRDLLGSIDEVSVYNYGLSAAQVRTLYASASTLGTTPAAVPEPASWAMMIGGFGATGIAMRRRRPIVSLA